MHGALLRARELGLRVVRLRTAMALDLILGYAGIISLGHAAFFGAYVMIVLAMITYAMPSLTGRDERSLEGPIGIWAFWLMVGGMFGMTMAFAAAGMTLPALLTAARDADVVIAGGREVKLDTLADAGGDGL